MAYRQGLVTVLGPVLEVEAVEDVVGITKVVDEEAGPVEADAVRVVRVASRVHVPLKINHVFPSKRRPQRIISVILSDVESFDDCYAGVPA